MSEAAVQAPRPEAAASGAAALGCYLYGIVFAETRTPAGPDGAVSVVRHRRIAALVRRDQPVPVRPTRERLLGHARLLDQLAQTDPVLPMRFGTVLDSPAAVERGVLAPNHDAFAAGLARLAGKTQFLLAARYLMEAVLTEVLAEQPAVLRLHRQLRERSTTADPVGRVRLGELVARAVAGKRDTDTAVLVAAVRPYAAAGRMLAPERAGADGVAELALLVEPGQRERFEAAAERLARQWDGRVRLRLRGPMAPYHFVDGLVGSRPGGR